MEALASVEQLILVGAAAPVAFFAYPGKPGWLAPEHCEILTLATVDEDAASALAAVADRVAAGAEAAVVPPTPEMPAPAGPLTPVAIGQSLVRSMPDETIVVDEAATCGLGIFPVTGQARRHDWLTLTGGAIGYRPARWRWVRRSPAPIARSWRCRPTAARCTRCRRCGAWRASRPTSPS